ARSGRAQGGQGQRTPPAAAARHVAMASRHCLRIATYPNRFTLGFCHEPPDASIQASLRMITFGRRTPEPRDSNARSWTNYSFLRLLRRRCRCAAGPDGFPFAGFAASATTMRPMRGKWAPWSIETRRSISPSGALRGVGLHRRVSTRDRQLPVRARARRRRRSSISPVGRSRKRERRENVAGRMAPEALRSSARSATMSEQTRSPQQSAARLTEMVDQILAEGHRLPEDLITWKPADDVWSVLEILCHVDEFIPFWTGETVRVVRDPAGEWGRDHTDSRRLEAVKAAPTRRLPDVERSLPAGGADAAARLSTLLRTDP